MWRRRVLVIRLVALLLSLQEFSGGAGPAWASELEWDLHAIRVDIAIKARQFLPSPVVLPVGRPVTLIFHNQDVELHAFVPTRFLEGVPVHVDGNGAPQFGERGLERVLIPSSGTEEIRFTPTSVGEFEYRCDLPGHQMVGKIAVKDHTGTPQSASEQNTGIQGNP